MTPAFHLGILYPIREEAPPPMAVDNNVNLTAAAIRPKTRAEVTDEVLSTLSNNALRNTNTLNHTLLAHRSIVVEELETTVNNLVRIFNALVNTLNRINNALNRINQDEQREKAHKYLASSRVARN